MPDARQEKRRRELKQREAELRRANEYYEAQLLFDDAKYYYNDGDPLAASRQLKKILQRDSSNPQALELLGQIHFEAGQNTDALYFWNLLRKHPDPPPEVLYLSGIANYRIKKLAEAQQSFEAALQALKGRRDKKWTRLRAESSAWLVDLQNAIAAAPAPAKPVKLAPPPPPKPEPAPPANPVPAVLQAELRVLPPESSPFESRGTLNDFFLRRGYWLLKHAQSFEDLVCLPSLEGVDAYLYQQETVRKVLRQFQGRALLADEVGLGKTIEACLVLKEYWQRGMVRRALILTPPSLVSQWRGEIENKFKLNASVPDTAAFRANPEQFWKEEPLVVASIALARRDSHAAMLADVHWDLVIVDEAHAVKNRTSANWRLINSLQKRFLLLLTATPVENNLIELYNLITLLKPGLLETEGAFKKRFVGSQPKTPKNPEQLRELLAEVMIRNTRSVVDVKLPRRIAATVTVQPSDAELALYNQVSAFVSERYGKQGQSTMALSALQRQAGSSPRAIGLATERAIAGGAGDTQPLREIAKTAAMIGESSKAVQLGSMLLEESGKTVVFTEFLATLDELIEMCRARSISYAVFRGDLSRADKEAAIARFRDEASVLLTTGAGGEGRNLQFARTVINYDLPWNPMRLEQRVGRVHRIGQTQDVFVFNFCQGGSVEEQLLRVLHDKINMFELVIGEIDAILGRLDDERDFADVILDLWASTRAEERGEAFDLLAGQLLTAKRTQIEIEELDRQLFQAEFEV